MEEQVETEFDEVLTGEKSLNEILGSVMLARLHFPEISEDLARFKRMSEEHAEVVNEIEELQSRKETLDEEIEETAETIREHIYNV